LIKQGAITTNKELDGFIERRVAESNAVASDVAASDVTDGDLL